jgi:RND family efflux transporter MFP subunit
LTIPEQAVSLVRVGQAVRLTVDAYPNEIFEAKVRFVSPSLRADQRALTIEAIAPNPSGRLKPGLYATASIQLPEPAPARLVPSASIETISGTSRVYVIKDGRVEERIVTIGDRIAERTEITSGVAAGEVIAADPKGRLTDGAAVTAR